MLLLTKQTHLSSKLLFFHGLLAFLDSLTSIVRYNDFCFCARLLETLQKFSHFVVLEAHLAQGCELSEAQVFVQIDFKTATWSTIFSYIVLLSVDIGKWHLFCITGDCLLEWVSTVSTTWITACTATLIILDCWKLG